MGVEVTWSCVVNFKRKILEACKKIEFAKDFTEMSEY